MKPEYTKPVGSHFDAAAIKKWYDLQNIILWDPGLHQFYHRKGLYLQTNFSAIDYEYAALQPRNH